MSFYGQERPERRDGREGRADTNAASQTGVWLGGGKMQRDMRRDMF